MPIPACLKQLMPGLLSVIVLMILACPAAHSATTAAPAANSAQQLGQMEQQLFSHSYEGEASDVRLTRIEKTVFGAPQSNMGIDARLQSLKQFFQPAPQPVVSSPPPTAAPNNSAPPQQAAQQEAPSQPGAYESQYPVVSSMEQRVFNQTYEKDTIEARLARLENRVMGHVQQGALQERSDQLRMMVLGETDPGGYNGSPANPMGNSGNGSSPPAMASSDLMQALPSVEKKVLKQTFPNDTPENRVSRLEMKLFNSTAPEMSLDDRFYRIAGVVMAQREARQEQMYAGSPSMSPFGMGGMGSGFGTGIYGSRRGVGMGMSSPYSSSSPSRGASAAGIGSLLLMMLMSMF